MAACPSCSTPVADGAKFCPTCGSAVPQLQSEDADPLLGKVIARNFRVESLLGTGGMGRVYKARQISLDKAVVLKVLHPHFNNDPQLVQRFQREARAASRLNHPNSISIIDFGQADDGTLFMAMELLHGKDLFTLLQEEFPIPEERLARIMVQVCSALAEAHEQNIIHRDLKPENIMVEDRRDQKDFVKVLDFGIAKIQDPTDNEGRALTQQGMVCGTPEYMSPEQARGENLDARSDIYALGVLMYQLVTGDLPFKAETALGIVTKHITEPPMSPRRVRPDLNIGEDVERIILKCLEKRVESRYQTATELGGAWKQFLEVRAERARAPAPAAPPPARKGTLAMGAAQPVSSAAASAGPGPGTGSSARVDSGNMAKTEAAMDVTSSGAPALSAVGSASNATAPTPARTNVGMPGSATANPATPAAAVVRANTSNGAMASQPPMTDELDAVKPKRTGLWLGLAGAALLGVAGAVVMLGPGPQPNGPVATSNPPDKRATPDKPNPDKPATPDKPNPDKAATPDKGNPDKGNPDKPDQTTVATNNGRPTAENPKNPDRKNPDQATSTTGRKDPDPRRDPGPDKPRDPANTNAAGNNPPDSPNTAGTSAVAIGDPPLDGDAEAVRELRRRAEARIGGGDFAAALKLLADARKVAPQDVELAHLVAKTAVKAAAAGEIEDVSLACNVVRDTMSNVKKSGGKAAKGDVDRLKKLEGQFCEH